MNHRHKAAAKVNLTLLVGPQRSDGYHEILSVFAPIDLCDELEFSLGLGPAADAPGRIEVVCPGVAGKKNLVVRALRAVEKAAGCSIEGKVRIHKGIPVGGGLGGGSADAAAALRVAARLLKEEGGRQLESEAVHSLARALGADVPFFLVGRPAIGRGIGDELEPLALPLLYLVLVLWDRPIGTAAAYGELDRSAPQEARGPFSVRTARMESEWRRLGAACGAGRMSALECLEGLSALLHNDLEAASFRLMPELIDAKLAIAEAGARGALMSGSGPTLFGVCASGDDAESVRARLANRGYDARVVTTCTEAADLPRLS